MRTILLCMVLALAGYAADVQVATGKRLYNAYGCYQCHGREGQGSSAGSRLAPDPIAFAAFARYLRQPAGQMPPYTAKVVPDAELTDIYAFLRSIPRPPKIEEIPLLRLP